MLFYEQEAVRTQLETGSTTISLTDDLEDQGALRSVVLSPTTNLQGAFWDQEGHVSRLKLIKRQGYGQAGFELLRTRVLLA